MKLSALIFLSILVLGVLIINQKNKTATLNAQSKEMQQPLLSRGIMQPPVVGEIALDITEPTQNSSVSSPNILISGKTEPNADIIINELEKKADKNGNFSISVIIDQGLNIIVLTAINAEGKYTEKEVRVTLLEDDQFTLQQ